MSEIGWFTRRGLYVIATQGCSQRDNDRLEKLEILMRWKRNFSGIRDKRNWGG